MSILGDTNGELKENINMMKVGVIGNGFIGGAIVQAFSLHTDVKLYDKYKEIGTIEDVASQDFIFVSVPTNVTKSGKQNLSCISDVLENLKNAIPDNKNPIILIKSTVLPGTNRMLAKKYRLRIVSNPEFLTARNARLDFINSARIVLGSESKVDLDKAESLYRVRFPVTPIYKTTWETAEMVKYVSNNLFSLKIAYLNEIYDVCQGLRIDYNDVKNILLADGRIGNSHADIPGHDGDRGFGGTCFPKDLKTFIHWAEENKFKTTTLWAAYDTNLRIRKEQDWIEDDD